MNYNQRKILRYIVDIACLAAAFIMAFMVRIDVMISWPWWQRIFIHIVPVIAVEMVCLFGFGAQRGAWRFISLNDVRRIVTALAASSVVLIVARLLLGTFSVTSEGPNHGILPWGVIVVNYCLAVLALSGIRVIHRLTHETRMSRLQGAEASLTPIRALLIGEEGAKVVIESMRFHSEKPIQIVGVLAVNKGEIGSTLADVKIIGDVSDLSKAAHELDANQAIICENSIHGGALRETLEQCASLGLSTRIVPRLKDIVEGKVLMGQLREVDVADLLHRDPIQLDKTRISEFLHGRRILVSGAGGSIGSEICRQILAFEPAEIVLLERCELFLYEIEKEMSAKAKNTKILPRLVDICDVPRLNAVFDESRPEVVFHAAAYKHVPMLEYNPGEAIRNNVEGTMNMANAADAHGCEAFVMISTDKAVNPTSVMGTSKRIAELYIQSMSSISKTRFCGVRFGNVLGSTGSVLPLFRSQLAQGGPLTVTHPEMVRYFMTIPEASQLVMQAGTMGNGGEIFVLDMGEPVKIVDLARDLIRLSGKSEKEISIVFTGTRPGEKLFEELGFDEEKMDHTVHPKIYVGKLKPVDRDGVLQGIEKLKLYRDSQDNAAVRAAMHELVPEMMEPAK